MQVSEGADISQQGCLLEHLEQHAVLARSLPARPVVSVLSSLVPEFNRPALSV